MPPLLPPIMYGGFVFTACRAYDKDGVLVNCSTKGHHKCKKWRGLQASRTAVFGPWEAVVFLLAWARHGAACTKKNHSKFPVTKEQVAVAFHELHTYYAPD